ncbi:unnamed protein product [Ilex paraguariensis]|uniref:YjeF C-terminal domain-containing protein n=1 Tax=Ilex paraguariensis TaxID=185542 RepID=A0ABC8R5A0_9AQUA
MIGSGSERTTLLLGGLLHLLQKVFTQAQYPDQFTYEECQINAEKVGGVTILRKGKSDLISDGESVKSVSIYGSPRRCGGQGDVLSGSVAVFLYWARQRVAELEPRSNPTMLGGIAGSILVRKAALLAFENKRRSTLTGDIIECLGMSLEDICPVNRHR